MEKLYPGFGRIPSKPDNRDFRMSDAMVILKSVGYQPKTWEQGLVLNQKGTQHCVGFSWAGWGISAPIVDKYTDEDGHKIYYEAKEIDREPKLENGSTIRSGAKVMTNAGRVGAYFFAWNVNEAAKYVSEFGPVVLGIDWYEGMLVPDETGLIIPTGGIVGGHAILWYGVDAIYATLRNSWGKDWGKNGDCKILLADLYKIWNNFSEACAATELPLTVPEPEEPVITSPRCCDWIRNLFN